MACAFGMETCKRYYMVKYARLPDLLLDLQAARDTLLNVVVWVFSLRNNQKHDGTPYEISNKLLAIILVIVRRGTRFYFSICEKSMVW